MIIVIGQSPELIKRLEESGREVTAAPMSSTHSLTALVMQYPELEAVVISLQPDMPWSDGHILSAAKIMQQKGCLILMGDGMEHLAENRMLTRAKNVDEVFQVLRTNEIRKPAQEPAAETVRHIQIRPVQKLKKTGSQGLQIDVIGSQQRVGCTTQALILWQYCHALGYTPAVVMPRENIQQLATASTFQSIPGGIQLDGIPIVDCMEYSYDCYIRDCGEIRVYKTLDGRADANCCILVAGAKPWELPHTTRGILALGNQQQIVILSFTNSDALAESKPLLGGTPAFCAPFVPDPWNVSLPVLNRYDTFLRPILENILAKEEKQTCFGDGERET